MVGNAMTREEIIAKARKLAAEGNIEAAKRAMAMAEGMGGQPAEDIKPNPDGTYGQPPEGMVYNPNTGQMTSRELMANNMDPSAATSAAVGAYQGLGFGFGDEVQGLGNAVIPGPGTAGERYAYGREYARAREDAARRDNPGLTTAGELGGAVATAMMPVGVGARGAQVAGRAAQVAPRAAQAVTAARNGLPLLTRAGGSAATGAAMGGVYGFGAGEGGLGPRAESARNAAILGGVFGAGVPMVGAGVEKALNARAGSRAIREAAKAGKSTSELFDEGDALYKLIADADVRVKPESAIRGYGDVAMGAAKEGADKVYPTGVPHPTPAGAAAYSLTKEGAEQAATLPEVPFSDIHTHSKIMRNIAGSNLANREDTRVAQAAKGKFDDWILGLGPDDVTSGDVAAMTEALPKARDTWSRARKSQVIDDAVERGQNYLSGGASGIKNRIKSILNNPKIASQYTEAERAAMRRVVDGTPVEKLIDTFGGGLGQMATMGVGGAIGSGAGGGGAVAGTLAGAGVGQIARRASEAMAAKNAELARAAIASGKLTGNLPTVNPQVRAIVEQLLRGNLAAAGGNLPR